MPHDTAPPMASVLPRAGKSSAPRFAPQTREESETVIILSNAHPSTARVWTAQSHLAKRLLRDHPMALAGCNLDDRGRITGLEFDLPIECIRIRPKRQLSDGQRRILERARAASRRVTLPREPPAEQGSIGLLEDGAENGGGRHCPQELPAEGCSPASCPKQAIA